MTADLRRIDGKSSFPFMLMDGVGVECIESCNLTTFATLISSLESFTSIMSILTSFSVVVVDCC